MNSSTLNIIFEDRIDHDLISERDKMLISHALLDNDKFLKYIEVIYLGKTISRDTVGYIHVQVFSDAGKNKRVYLVRIYAKLGKRFQCLDDLDVIPLYLNQISSSKVIAKLKNRIDRQKEEIGKIKRGLMRPFLIKVWRDFDTLMEDHQLDYETMIESTAHYIFGAAMTLQKYGMYPHFGELFLVEASGKEYHYKAWLETQGIIPGLSLAEKLEEYDCRLKDGIFIADKYNERVELLKIIAVSGYLQMWRILRGAYITDPTMRNILIEGTYEDGYFSVFFDIDRLTLPGKPLLELLEKLRCGEIGNNPTILLSGYVSTFTLKVEDARAALEYLLQLIKSARRTYSQLSESITAALSTPEAYYRGTSALHMRSAPARQPGLPTSLFSLA